MAGVTFSIIANNVPRYRTFCFEVIAVNVVNKAVSVIVYTIVRNLRLIYPHVVLEVRMGVFYTLVNHCNNDIRVSAGNGCPYVKHIHVGSGKRRLRDGCTTIVFVVPLVG